jgi:uncharacterized membrane protein
MFLSGRFSSSPWELCILPILLIWRLARFERARWSESDHPGTMWMRSPESTPEEEEGKEKSKGKVAR